MLEVSVIIVSYQSRRFLTACLESVSKHLKETTFEVIVVDNGSGDAFCSSIRKQFPSITLIQNSENRGFPAAVNQALEVAKGRYFLLLNQDTELIDDNFSEVLSYLENNPEVGLLGLCQVSSEMERIPSTSSDRCLNDRRLTVALASLYLTRIFPRARHSYSQGPYAVGYTNGAAAILSRRLIEVIGFLDEQFFFMVEELDLGFRTNQAGFEVHFFPNFRVLHHRASGKGGSLWRLLQYHLGDIKLYRKYGASALEARFFRVVWLVTRIGTSLLKLTVAGDRRARARMMIVLSQTLIWHLSGGIVTFHQDLK